ncbi:MAG: hypothetical protein V4690_00335 [Patescibacteria group bacterium]
MSKQNLERVLLRELDFINDEIDKKIIRGLSYAKEARRHKFILNRLSDIRRAQDGNGWFARSFNTFSII